MKRFLDFVIALALLMALAPLVALIAAAIWLADLRSPWFAAPRIGKNGVPFVMIKFRTMQPDAWKSGVNSTAEGDRRITPIGKRLRRYKLDELPQLMNVLLGQMSLVGPRPQVPAEVALYTPEERRMLQVPPGITDLASIVFADEGAILAGSADPDLDYRRFIRPSKSRLALLYIDRRSLALDLRILAWTALALIRRRRALDRVSQAVARWGADATLERMCARRDPLIAYPPPGSDQVIEAPAKAVGA